MRVGLVSAAGIAVHWFEELSPQSRTLLLCENAEPETVAAISEAAKTTKPRLGESVRGVWLVRIGLRFILDSSRLADSATSAPSIVLSSSDVLKRSISDAQSTGQASVVCVSAFVAERPHRRLRRSYPSLSLRSFHRFEWLLRLMHGPRSELLASMRSRCPDEHASTAGAARMSISSSTQCEA